MQFAERSRDLYEQIPGYPQPPLIPLPAPGDLSPFQEFGIKPGKFSDWVTRTAVRLSGFYAFQTMLPAQIETLLRRVNIRGPALYAPVVAAAIALRDDPRQPTPFQRAALLLQAMRSLHHDVMTAQLPPDTVSDDVLEMGQYPNLFAASFIFEDGRPRIFKSTAVSPIAVVVEGRIYVLDLDAGGSTATPAAWAATLAAIARQSQDQGPAQDAPGLLTAASDATQRAAFPQLIKNPANAQSLTTLRHTLVTLCLDLESHPSTLAEALYLAHSGNPRNRWQHASVQIVVFGNGKACLICNFNAYLDGNVMMRAGAELQRRAENYDLPEETAVVAPPSTPLTWEIPPETLTQAQADVEHVLDRQQATFTLPAIGANFFRRHGLAPVPTFVVALEMAVQRLLERPATITQFLAMSKYRCMDLVMANVATPEVVQAARRLSDPTVQGAEALRILQAAEVSQRKASQAARRHLPLDDMLPLFFSTLSGWRERRATLTLRAALLLLHATGNLRREQRQILISHPAIYPETPLVGRPGARLPYVKYFGLHYQIFADEIVVTMMPALAWDIPNEQVVTAIGDALKQIQAHLRK